MSSHSPGLMWVHRPNGRSLPRLHEARVPTTNASTKLMVLQICQEGGRSVFKNKTLRSLVYRVLISVSTRIPPSKTRSNVNTKQMLIALCNLNQETTPASR